MYKLNKPSYFHPPPPPSSLSSFPPPAPLSTSILSLPPPSSYLSSLPSPSFRPPSFPEKCVNFLTNMTQKLDSSCSLLLPRKLKLDKPGEKLVLLGQIFTIATPDQKKMINEAIKQKYDNIIWFSYRSSFPIIGGGRVEEEKEEIEGWIIEEGGKGGSGGGVGLERGGDGKQVADGRRIIEEDRKELMEGRNFISDTGWGCMIRCAQMMFAVGIERATDLISSEIIPLFNDADCDAIGSPFSLQQLIPLTFSLHSLTAGDFFTGPKVLETLSVLNQIYQKLNISIIQFVDGCIFINEILKEVAGGRDGLGEEGGGGEDQKEGVKVNRTEERGAGCEKEEEVGIKNVGEWDIHLGGGDIIKEGEEEGESVGIGGEKDNTIEIMDEEVNNFKPNGDNKKITLERKEINLDINNNSVSNRKRSYSLIDPRPALIIDAKRERCCHFFRKKGLWPNLCPSCRLWERSILITVCLGLGEKKINRKTEEFVRRMLELKFSVGALGGKGKKAMFVVGMKGKYLICKDPHYVQIVQTNLSDFSSYFSKEEKVIRLTDADSSMIFGFLIRNELEFDEFLTLLKLNEEELGENWLMGLQNEMEMEELSNFKLRVSMNISMDDEGLNEEEDELNELKEEGRREEGKRKEEEGRKGGRSEKERGREDVRWDEERGLMEGSRNGESSLNEKIEIFKDYFCVKKRV